MKKVFGFIVIIGVLAFVFLKTDLIRRNEIINQIIVVEVDLNDFEDLMTSVVESASQAVVGVTKTQGTSSTIGSGFVYKATAVLINGNQIPFADSLNSSDIDYYCYWVITNKHVVEDATSLKVYLGNVEVNATLVQYHDKIDIAAIYFESSQLIVPLELADSSMLKPGSFAIAIGNPYSYDYFRSVTFGIISYPIRIIPEDTDGDSINDYNASYIQHDVAINPGNSGGPLINLEGKVIGINTMKFVASTIDNMGFSIPSNLVIDFINNL